MPRFAATYLSFFAARSVCIGVYPWLKTGSVAAPLLQVFRVFRGKFCGYSWRFGALSFRSQRTRDNPMCMESGHPTPPVLPSLPQPDTLPTPPSLPRPKTPPAKWAYARWLLLRSIPVALVLLLIGAAWQFVLMRRARPLQGVYLLPDGISYVVLKPGFWPALRVSEGYIYSAVIEKKPEHIEFSATPGLNRMALTQVQTLLMRTDTGEPLRLDNTLVLRLRESQTTPGDWDLEHARFEETAGKPDPGSTSLPLSLRNAIRKSVVSLLWPDIYTGELNPSNAPIPSFLHQIPDERVVELCSNQAWGKHSDHDLNLLRELTKEDPLDACLGLRRVELEARAGNFAEGEQVLQRWNAAYGASADPLLHSTAIQARRFLDAGKWRKQHVELVKDWGRIGSNEKPPAFPPLPEQFRWLREAGKTDSLYPDMENVIRRVSLAKTKVPNFLAIQILAKVARIQSSFCLVQGDKARSLELLAGTYWMGQSLNATDLLISKLIGMAVRSIATGGLELLAFEGSQSPEELREVWDILERLADLPGQETGLTLLDGEMPPVLARMQISGIFAPNMEEPPIRQKTSDAKFAALRTAIAAQYRRMTDGAFPKSPAEFAPLLPGGPLGDCFATSAPLKFLEKPDGFYVYSIGPDGQDDALTISYDPTNGAMSRGDVSVRVPRKREYPFPAGGVRVNTAAELLKIFPNGLPPDLFADTKGRPLSIFAASRADWEACAVPGAKKIRAGGAPGADDPKSSSTLPRAANNATAPTPVAVFSFGPDTDEYQYSDYQYLTGEDVFTTYSLAATPCQLVFPVPGIPQPTRQTPPPMPAYVDSLLRGKTITIPPGSIGLDPGFQDRPANMTGIHRGFGQASSGEYLQPPYDPTNGITSKGNLYLIFPRPEAPTP